MSMTKRIIAVVALFLIVFTVISAFSSCFFDNGKKADKENAYQQNPNALKDDNVLSEHPVATDDITSSDTVDTTDLPCDDIPDIFTQPDIPQHTISEPVVTTEPLCDEESEKLTQPYSPLYTTHEPVITTIEMPYYEEETEEPYTTQEQVVMTEVTTEEKTQTSHKTDDNVDWEHGWQP